VWTEYRDPRRSTRGVICLPEGVVAPPPPSREQTMSRTLVLVTVDSLRADHCGFHGCDRDTTPTLDRKAAAGVDFEHAIAPGPKTPSPFP